MTNQLIGKTAAITGAASGIGLECARTMIAAGADVVLIDQSEEGLASACADLGDKAHPLVVDLLDGPVVTAMMPKIIEVSRTFRGSRCL